MENIVTEKRCSKCNEIKPLSEFYKSKRGLFGHKSRCKKCEYNKEKKSLYYQEHRDGYLKQFKEYRLRFIDEIREREKIYRREHKEQSSKRRSEYRKNHPEKERQWRRNKWARRFSNGDRVTDKEWKDILRTYNNKCVKCGSEEDITQDHIVPVSKGGRHIASNLQPLCRSCNSRKHTQIADYRK